MILYTSLAHTVAKKLSLRPNTILDSWGVAELLVAYGQYANEDSYRNFLEWKSSHGKGILENTQPEPYAVIFLTREEAEIMMETEEEGSIFKEKEAFQDMTEGGN